MDPTAMFMAGLVVLPAVGLVAWAWLAMAQAEEDLLVFSRFDGLHREV